MTLAVATTGSAITARKYSSDEEQLIMQTVAKKCTKEEFGLLMQLCTTYDLNPFAKEIWAIKMKEGEAAVIMTSRDGYIKISQRDANYMGFQSAVVREGDAFSFDPVNGAVQHSFGAKRGAIMGAWAIAHHRLRLPMVCYVEFSEYRGATPIWGKYPSAMIQKVAEVFVLKRQFGISGLVTREEMDVAEDEGDMVVRQSSPAPAETHAPATPRKTKAAVEKPEPVKLPTAKYLPEPVDSEEFARRQLLVRTAREANGLTTEEVGQLCYDNFYHGSIRQMLPVDLNRLVDVLIPGAGQDKLARAAEANVHDAEFEEIPAGAVGEVA
jgi:phage recombination protein Bet